MEPVNGVVDRFLVQEEIYGSSLSLPIPADASKHKYA